MSAAPTETQPAVYAIEHLSEFARRVLISCDVPEDDARQAADVLATADLWGIDSHGVARLDAYYEMLARGLVNPRPRITVVRQLPGTATVDGDNGLGLVVGPKANEMAMEKASVVGSGWVAVCNSNHFGVAGYYPIRALGRDLIGWAMTNTPALVTPARGAGRMIGTNPIAVAFPGKTEPPVVVDMATSAVSYGIVETALRRGEPLAEGLIVDHEGRPTTRPEDFAAGGSLLPLGGASVYWGHKGYCLGAMVDLLCGALSGANWGPFIPPFPFFLKRPERSVGKGLGHLFGALRIDGFIDPEEFKRQVDEWVRVFRATAPAPDTRGPLIPGDPERAAEDRRRVEGVALSESVLGELRRLSARTGVPFD